MRTRLFVSLFAAATLAAGAGAVSAQSFPDHPVKIINAFPAGSGPDAVARMLADKLGKAWGQPVVIENRPGGNGFIAMEAAKRAAPAGYDLAVVDVGHMAINPSLFKQLPYDPVKDYTPLTMLYRTAFFVMVGQQSPIKSIPDLVAAARQAPGKVTYGSWAVGSPGHLGGAQVEAALGAPMLHVPFKDTAQLYTAVANGDIAWALGSLATAGPLVQAGKLRILAVADSHRSPAMPDVPTVREAGMPVDIDASTWVALIGPAGMPPDVAARINKSVRAALDEQDVKDKMGGFGFAPAGGPSEQLAQAIRADMVRYAGLVKASGASAE